MFLPDSSNEIPNVCGYQRACATPKLSQGWHKGKIMSKGSPTLSDGDESAFITSQVWSSLHIVKYTIQNLHASGQAPTIVANPSVF